MSLDPEDNPVPPKPPNDEDSHPWRVLGQACREAVQRPRGPSSIRHVLRRALEASGAERAYLVRCERGPSPIRPVIDAWCSHRGDGMERPSRTVLLRALAGPRPFVCADVADDLDLARGASVRGLALRCVFSAPVPVSAPERCALVIDSRSRPVLPFHEARRLLESFAGLVGLVLPTKVAGSARGSVEPPDRGAEPDRAPGLAGEAPAFLRMIEWVGQVAGSDLPVLIRGETGSGKEIVARELHARSPRRTGPFVAVNCTALTESLLDAELFGAVRGAYTGSERDRPGLFRLAQGGTLLLDEVGDMSPPMQAKLLRVIQEGRLRPVGGEREVAVDVRTLAATHRDLALSVARREFRADLYYRLAVLQVRVPPLRERTEDLELLVRNLTPRLIRETRGGPLTLAPCAWAALRAHRWPGNVRELHAVLARALLRAGGEKITARHLGTLNEEPARPEGEDGRPVPLERRMIESAMRQAGGSITRAARRIGWTRQKLYRRVRTLGIARPDDDTRR